MKILPESATAPRERGGAERLATNPNHEISERPSVVNWSDAKSGKVTASLWNRAFLKVHGSPNVILTLCEEEPLALIEQGGVLTAIVHESYGRYNNGDASASAFGAALSALTNRSLRVLFTADAGWQGSSEMLFQAYLDQLVWLYPRAVWMRQTALTDSGDRLQIDVPQRLLHRTRHKVAAEYLQRLEDCWLSATGRAVVAYFAPTNSYEQQ